MDRTRRHFLEMGIATALAAGIHGAAPLAAQGASGDRRGISAILKDHADWLSDPATGTRADLAGRDLRGLRLTNVDLRHARFDQADLSGAQFTGCELSGATFVEAKLDQAVFKGCWLVGSNFAAASLEGATVDSNFIDDHGSDRSTFADGINCEQANLRHAILRFAIGWGSFAGADLRHADLRENILEATHWGTITFRGANLNFARFDESQLVQVDFTNASLRGTSFRTAELRWNTFSTNTACLE